MRGSLNAAANELAIDYSRSVVTRDSRDLVQMQIACMRSPGTVVR